MSGRLGGRVTVDVHFRYAGEVRHVTDALLKGNVLCGRELRKRGRFSRKVKSYRLDRFESVPEQLR